MSQTPDTESHDEGYVDDAVQALFEVGRLWARHGLRVGKLALSTSARTLEVTADTLGDLSDRLEH